MKYIIFIIISILFLSACSREKRVIVVDSQNLPVINADIYSISLSMNRDVGKTNVKGEVAIPYNIQDIKWISIKKPGYHTIQVSVPEAWPLKIMLKKK